MRSSSRREYLINKNNLLISEDYNKNHFNSLRLMMAIAVIWSHAFALYYGSEDSEPLSLLLNGQYNAGNVAVRVFFIISGFLITISYLHSSSLLSYMRKRVARIYPGFIVAVMLCAFIVVPLFSTQVELTPTTIWRTIWRAFTLKGAMPPSDVFAGNPGIKAVNGALWSIPFEFWCYIAIAALGALRLLRWRLFLLVAMLTIMIGRAVLDFVGIKPGIPVLDNIIGWSYLWFSVAPCFLAGALAYLYRDRLPRSGALAVALSIAFVGAAHTSDLLCDALFPIATAYLTFYVAFGGRALPDFAKFGDFSYGTYLYGFPIEQMLVTASLPFLLYVPAAIFLSLCAGTASWFIVERRFLKRRSQEMRQLGVSMPAPVESFARSA